MGGLEGITNPNSFPGDVNCTPNARAQNCTPHRDLQGPTSATHALFVIMLLLQSFWPEQQSRGYVEIIECHLYSRNLSSEKVRHPTPVGRQRSSGRGDEDQLPGLAYRQASDMQIPIDHSSICPSIYPFFSFLPPLFSISTISFLGVCLNN